MVVQQGPQLRLEFTGDCRTGPQRCGKRGTILQCALQVTPLRTAQTRSVIRVRQAQTAFRNQAIVRVRSQCIQASWSAHPAAAGARSHAAAAIRRFAAQPARHRHARWQHLPPPWHRYRTARGAGHRAPAGSAPVRSGSSPTAARHRRHHMPALATLHCAGSGSRLAAKGHVQQLQWAAGSDAELELGPLGALGHQRDAAMVARKDLQDQAGLAPVMRCST
jgi:hypothetical protein